MNHIVLSLTDPQAPMVTLRCRSYAGFVNRLSAVEGRVSAAVDGSADAATALTGLAAAAGLASQGEPPRTGEVRYVPTPAARERVGAEHDGVWPQSLASRQRKTIRRTPGALFTFPLEDPTPADVTLEVFTTDWSPSPAACAVAVHPGHPLSSGLEPGRGSAFTGRYCRHPLTGDLLPIWTAAWVKPEFGTGAVLVNPGHDAADLAFGREIGLPVRFALAPAGHDDSPKNWLAPPVVKTGKAIRTGATDGLDFTAAQTEYFRILVDRELAREYVDFGAGSFTVAAFTADGPDKIHWDQERRTVTAAGQESSGSPAQVSPAAVLAVLDPATREAELSVVAPSSAIESDLLALRLLLAEPGLGPTPERAPDVLLVGTVTGKSDGVGQDVLELALLTAAAPQETLPVKTQQLETAQRFLAAHTTLTELDHIPEGDADAATTKAAGQIKTLLQRKDTKQAFTHLYRLQKTLAKGGTPLSGTLALYEALAWVIAGLPTRSSQDQLSDAWQLL
ncbi:class I tRNA ligase family protein [Streptomyces sp. NBC_01142]|uniref:class I tRNA ligase family protein n=1 Tax=Streptomyces sp. NBC_01142 TaxID=2975865 RepID=UPI00225786B8|nr:class I tRNA ligase family protein [Streptomyces sp. NBC_01142]MCX4827001.1 class I tRNA ligase family protein [Streptomyces sp. NBC_01142]